MVSTHEPNHNNDDWEWKDRVFLKGKPGKFSRINIVFPPIDAAVAYVMPLLNLEELRTGRPKKVDVIISRSNRFSLIILLLFGTAHLTVHTR